MDFPIKNGGLPEGNLKRRSSCPPCRRSQSSRRPLWLASCCWPDTSSNEDANMALGVSKLFCLSGRVQSQFDWTHFVALKKNIEKPCRSILFTYVHLFVAFCSNRLFTNICGMLTLNHPSWVQIIGVSVWVKLRYFWRTRRSPATPLRQVTALWDAKNPKRDRKIATKERTAAFASWRHAMTPPAGQCIEKNNPKNWIKITKQIEEISKRQRYPSNPLMD